ncbi:MAG: YwbE family protein [Candidatus Thorarchaeota archaeon]|nr:MAG: YwbE family protein [Candidatus Thorarchaeota archaeon]
MNTETDNAGTHRENIRPGLVVDVILKKDQTTGKLTRGVIRDILTNSSVHPRGIKVRLSNGQVGRVRTIPKQSSGRPVM